MTLLSLPTSAWRNGHFMTVTNAVRVTAVLMLLTLVAVAAENYFDPQHQFDAAQATFDPRAD